MSTLGTLARSLSPAELLAALGRNWRLLIGAIALIAVGGGVWAAYDWYQARREGEARAAMIRAYAEIRKTETESKDRDEAVRKVLERLSVEQKGTRVGGEALIRLGNRLHEAGQFDGARDTFGKYLQEYSGGPWHVAAAIGKAYAEEAKGELSAAEKTLQTVLDTSRNDPLLGEAQMSLARIYEQAKKPDEALKLYGQLAEKYPQSQWAQQAMERMGRLKSK